MPRTFVAAWVALAVAAVLPAQAPGASRESLVLLLRDPSGAPVAGAQGYLQSRREPTLPALADVPTSALPFPDAAPTVITWRGASDDHGMLRFAAPAAAAGKLASATAASGMVWTEHGLGALVLDLQPGRAQRLELQPMAAVTTATGSEEFTLFAQARLPGDHRVTLLPLTGTSVRLPPGTYEVWAHSADGWTWQQVSLASGQRTLLEFDGQAQRLRRRADARLFPAAHPEIDLFAGSDETVLHGAALAAPLTAFVEGHLVGPQLLPLPPILTPLPWPPATPNADGTHCLLPVGDKPTKMVVYCLRRSDQDRWQHLATCPAVLARGVPEILVPPLPTGDRWLLLLAQGYAPTACSWHEGRTTFPFQLEPGEQLHVHATDEHGLPVVDLAVDYTPDDMDPARVVGHTDGRGSAHLGAVRMPGLLRVSDERFANQELRLTAAPGDGVGVEVARGEELRGHVRWPDGKPANNILVALRDPRGKLRPAVRSQLSRDDGSFTFPGLPPDAPLLLSATSPHNGHTWSAQLPGLRAGGDDVVLELRDEDPRLDHDTGR